jgi:hypothetical protein
LNDSSGGRREHLKFRKCAIMFGTDVERKNAANAGWENWEMTSATIAFNVSINSVHSVRSTPGVGQAINERDQA